MKLIEQKIRSLYHSTVFLWLVSAFFHIFSFFWVCLCRHFVCFSPVSRPRTQILSLFILAAILNKFPLSVDKSVTWFLLCARGRHYILPSGRKNVLSMRELFSPRSPGRVWKNGGISNVLLHKNKMFPLITFERTGNLSSKVASCGYNLVVT